MGTKTECTTPKIRESIPLFMTYWPGMTINDCDDDRHKSEGNHGIVATGLDLKITIPKAILVPRKANTYEACYWVIKPDDTAFYEPKSKLEFEAKTTNGKGKFYFYKGTSRQNATFVGSGSRMELPINEGALVVFQTIYYGADRGEDPSYYGSGEFTVKVKGKIIGGPLAEFKYKDLLMKLGFALNIYCCFALFLIVCLAPWPKSTEELEEIEAKREKRTPQ